MFWHRRKPLPEVVWHVPEGREDLVPQRKTEGSLAFDLVSPEGLTIPKYHFQLGVGSALINTMVIATLPPGHGLMFASRSGLANKGVTVQAGVIDADYRGFLKVLLFNFRGEDYEIEAGDRIAQARLVKIQDLTTSVSFEYPDPDETARGARGFGSTGR
jgi:dUTP pyrophosphatase